VREKSTQHIRIVSLNLSDAIDFERRSREARLASMNPSFVQAHPYNLRSEGEGSSRRAGRDKGRMVLHSIVHGASGLPGSVLSRYIEFEMHAGLKDVLIFGKRLRRWRIQGWRNEMMQWYRNVYVLCVCTVREAGKAGEVVRIFPGAC
jgi:hypothetical protein